MRVGKYLVLFSIVISFLNLLLSYFFRSACIENYGIAFGWEIGNVEVLSFVLLVLLLLLGFTSKDSLKYIFLSLGVAGSSNLIERIINGFVCDFIPVFNIFLNLVDIWITVLVAYAVLSFFKKENGSKDRGE
jgi:lipoprotein signal peptidase